MSHKDAGIIALLGILALALWYAWCRKKGTCRAASAFTGGNTSSCSGPECSAPPWKNGAYTGPGTGCGGGTAPTNQNPSPGVVPEHTATTLTGGTSVSILA